MFCRTIFLYTRPGGGEAVLRPALMLLLSVVCNGRVSELCSVIVFGDVVCQLSEEGGE